MLKANLYADRIDITPYLTQQECNLLGGPDCPQIAARLKDGTLKPEERHAEGMIIASNRPGFPQKNSSRPSSDKIIIGKREVNGERGAKAPLIYAEDEEKS